jgi:hypothetical protein
VEIVRRLAFTPIDVYPTVPAPAVVSPPEPVSLCLMIPDDAVARCTYAVYGYTMPDDYRTSPTP